MFLPMSWTSPLTVAMTILPLALASPPPSISAHLLGLDVGQQVGDRLLHHARRLHHLRQEHLALAEQVADDVHAGHQRPFDHVQRPAALGLDPCQAASVSSTMKSVMPWTSACESLSSTVFGCSGVPRQARRAESSRDCALGLLGDLDQALAGVLPAVEHHVLDPLAQLGVEVVVDADHAGVDDAHVHPRLDRVIEEHGVDGFAHRVVAAEREADVGDAARDLGAGQVLP